METRVVSRNKRGAMVVLVVDSLLGEGQRSITRHVRIGKSGYGRDRYGNDYNSAYEIILPPRTEMIRRITKQDPETKMIVESFEIVYDLESLHYLRVSDGQPCGYNGQLI